MKFKVNKTKDFTVMSNSHFKDKRMSLKAKGLLSLMLSLPDDWDYSIIGLVTLSSDGETSVRNALKELEEFGYLIRHRIYEAGKITDWQYDIYETPMIENLDVENLHVENKDNKILNNKCTKSIYNADVENLDVENHALDIHKIISTDFKDMCEPPLDGYNVQGAWENLLEKLNKKQNYPKSKLGASYHAKRNYMKLFSGAYNSVLIDKTVTYAISLYIQDYRKSHETDDYLKNLNSWFEDDIEYWWREAEEYIKKQEERKQEKMKEDGDNVSTTQSNE